MIHRFATSKNFGQEAIRNQRMWLDGIGCKVVDGQSHLCTFPTDSHMSEGRRREGRCMQGEVKKKGGVQGVRRWSTSNLAHGVVAVVLVVSEGCRDSVTLVTLPPSCTNLFTNKSTSLSSFQRTCTCTLKCCITYSVFLSYYKVDSNMTYTCDLQVHVCP